MNVDRRVKGTGSWSFVIGSDFELIDNGSSVQAAHGGRVVYVSSHGVGREGERISAEQLHIVARRKLGDGEHVSHEQTGLKGEAVLQATGNGWCLKGFMCAGGTIATCLVDFVQAEDRAWAVAVWRSLRHAETAG